MHMLLRIGLNSAAAWLTVWLVPGLSFDGEWWWWLVLGLTLGLINSIIRPIAKLLTLPVRILTLGLFTLVVNVGLMAAAIWIAVQPFFAASSSARALRLKFSSLPAAEFPSSAVCDFLGSHLS